MIQPYRLCRAVPEPQSEAVMSDEAKRETDASEIEVTAAMIEAAEAVIWEEIGGSDMYPTFSSERLARRVYLAMESARASFASRDIERG
jgi:hypothetical protein